jgi:alkaline phosphatase
MKNTTILGLFRSRAKAPGLLAVGVLALSQTLFSPAAFAATDESYSAQKTNNTNKLRDIKAKSYQLPPTRAKNVILFVGDGMGVSTITAARILEGQNKSLTGRNSATGTEYPTGEENLLSFEEFPYSALSRTYSVNQQVSDSAPTMSAMVTGIKTNDGELSVTPEVLRTADLNPSLNNGQKTETIAEQCKKRGMGVGIVTTARVTHATPAACYAHTSERNWECDMNIGYSSGVPKKTTKDIAAQLLDWNGGLSADVVLGGGRKYFMKYTQNDPEYPFMTGLRQNRDLIDEWMKLPTKTAVNPRSAYVWNLADFNKVNPSNVDRLLGLFEPSHVQYEADRATDVGKEPSLSEMTQKAIQVLQKNRNGFFLMVEGGRIDHAHHAGNAYRALTDTIAFSDAVRAAKALAGPDTLIVVTADHSHTFTIAGYPERGNPILGYVVEPTSNGVKTSRKVSLDSYGLPYTTLGYANGGGYIAGGSLTTYSASAASGTLTGAGTASATGLIETLSVLSQGSKFQQVNIAIPSDDKGVGHYASKYLTSLAANTYDIPASLTRTVSGISQDVVVLPSADGFTALSSGTSKTSPRPNLFAVETTNKNFMQEAAVPLGSETHGGEDVAIFATGPNAHLFHGSLEQSMIYWIMADALRLNP